ncbi:MAG: hypothetical protein GEU94_06610 [Micromonosporaceae bacterium]|nr:hypothetical protein [Micromonosporaceae bacterium]
MIICNKCGRQNPPGSRFCAGCNDYLNWERPQDATIVTGGPVGGQLPGGPIVQPGPQRHSVQVSVRQRELAVAAGEQVQVEVLVRNNGTIVEDLTVMVGGPAAAWATVEHQELSLMPGEEATSHVTFLPPRAPTTPSGPAPFQISAASRVHHNIGGSESGVLMVQGYAAPSVQLSPHTASGRFGGRHHLTVQNDGSLPLAGPIFARDPDELLRFTVQPQGLQVPPGGRGTAVIKSKPVKRVWWGSPARRPFQIAMHPAGQPPLETEGVLEQTPIIPRGMLPVAALAMAAVLAVGGFFALRGGDDPEVKGDTGTPTPTIEQPSPDQSSGDKPSPSDPPKESPSESPSESPTVHDGGVVDDQGFEEQLTDAVSAPWQKRGPGPSGVERDTGQARTGANVAALRSGNSGEEWNDIIQTVDVQPHRDYRLTGWIKTSGNLADGYFGVREGVTPTGAYAEKKFGPLAAYKKVKVDFNSGDNTQMTIFIGCWSFGEPVQALIDDVSLTLR